MSENELSENELNYRNIIESLLQGLAIIQDGRILLCNEALCRMNGFSKEETYRMSGEDVAAIIHPEDRQRALQAMTEIMTGGKSWPADTLRMLDKQGNVRWAEVLAVRTLYNGKPALQVSYFDVTKRKRAEAAHRTLADHALEGFAILQNGRVVLANQALAAMSGYSVTELLRAPAAEIAAMIHEDDRARILRTMTQHLESADIQAAQLFRFQRKDGGVRWVETHAVAVDLDGSPATQVSLQDVTARKEIESQLKDAHQRMRNLAGHLLHAREEERRKIAQDIHDQLGQTLAALKMDLHWLSKRLGGDTVSLRDKIKGTIDLGDEAIKTVQRITADLRPRMLDDLGLAPALDWLGADFARRTKIVCKVTTDFPLEVVGGNAATTLYRIAQEALANVGRHSHADHAAVRLYVSDGKLNLQIEDDGIGITAEQAAAPDSYGLTGIRERVEGLGGSLLISGEPGFGTILLALIPLPKEGGLA